MTDILYGAPLSLYSGKARSYLDWKAVDYREEMSTQQVYKEKIVPNIGYPVIPVMETADGRFLQDTTVIIDHYEESADGPSIYPDTPVQHLVALLFELFGDEWLTIPAMHYRWNHNEEWVYGEFGKASMPDLPYEEQVEVGRKVGANFKGFCPMLGITEATIPAIEASYEALLCDLDAHFTVHDYLLGSRPSIGDFGMIGPLYAHLYRDPKSGELMKRISPKVAEWVERMVDVKTPRSGEFLAGDQIPETLHPVLRRLLGEQMPFLAESAQLYAAWTAENPDKDPPRAVGMAGYVVEGTPSQRAASTFTLWMLQRPLDYYNGLDSGAKDAADTLLTQVGGEGFQNFDLPKRVKFKGHKIRQG